MENILVNTRVKPNVYAARSLLQEQDRRFLRLVMLCGGYFTRSQAARLKLRTSPKASFKRYPPKEVIKHESKRRTGHRRQAKGDTRRSQPR